MRGAHQRARRAAEPQRGNRPQGRELGASRFASVSAVGGRGRAGPGASRPGDTLRPFLVTEGLPCAW